MVQQLTQHDPRRIGPFEVLGRLGSGGMGLVYLARSASGRRVAIKTVRTELAEETNMKRREVISKCMEMGVPIFQGRIDKTLFLSSLRHDSQPQQQAAQA
jgi:serine/threonine protein kinase